MTRDLRRRFWIMLRIQILATRIIAVPKIEFTRRAAANENFTDAKKRTRQPLPQLVPRRSRPRCRVHLKARPISIATRSNTSRSSPENAFTFALSAAITPTAWSDWLMMGTTISESVVPKVGR